MRILLRTLFLLLPLALFSGGLCWVYTGNTGLSTAESILAVLAGAVILVSWEVSGREIYFSRDTLAFFFFFFFFLYYIIVI